MQGNSVILIVDDDDAPLREGTKDLISAMGFISKPALASVTGAEAGMRGNCVISIVDDDASVREGTKDLINAMGFVPKTFKSANEFLRSDALAETACLITDVRMPRVSGFELYDRLLKQGNNIPTILVTAFPNETDKARALKAGAICYLSKPFSETELMECVRSALGCYEAK